MRGHLPIVKVRLLPPAIQCKHSISATVDWTSGCETLVYTYLKNKQSTSMSHIACETKLLSVVTSHMHQYPGNCVAYRACGCEICPGISAGIKWRHCTCTCSFANTFLAQSVPCVYFETTFFAAQLLHSFQSDLWLLKAQKCLLVACGTN